MGFSEENAICRLCLKELTENCEPMEEIVQYTLNFLTLSPNLAISDDPMMCETCAVNLKKCFDFKEKCLSTQDCIYSFAKGEDESVDLRVIYSKVKLGVNIDRVPDDHNICRFCLELVKDDASTSLKHDVDLIAVLQKYFLEMGLRIKDDIIACTPCHNSLRFHVSFVNNYLSIEEKINEYWRVEGANCKGRVHLKDVATFISKSMLYVESISSVIIKEDERKNTNTNIDVKVEFKDPIDVEQEKEKLIHEEIQQSKNSSLKHPPSPSQSDSEPTRAKPVKYSDSKMKQRPNLNRHMLTRKTRSEITMYKCETCSYATKRKRYLRSHKLIHLDRSEVEMHKCEVCPFETKWKRYLRRHLLSHRSTPGVEKQSTMYKCDLCDYKAKLKSNLKRHMLTHKTPAEITMYKCEACSYETKYKCCLQNHKLIHLDISEVEMHKCEVCPFETKRKHYLKIHLLSHRNTPDVETKLKPNLSRHMLTHETRVDINIYKCETCSYETKYRSDLQKHKLIHLDRSEVEMHKCEECHFETKWKQNLRIHLLSHRNTPDVVMQSTMYKCDLCDYETTQKSYLKKHILTHRIDSEVTRYKCDLCAYKTKRMFDLKRHMRTHKTHLNHKHTKNMKGLPTETG